MSEQTEMEEVKTEEQKKSDALAEEINACLKKLSDLGLDCLLVASQSELGLVGVWCNTENVIVRNGLARLADQKI